MWVSPLSSFSYLAETGTSRSCTVFGRVQVAEIAKVSHSSRKEEATYGKFHFCNRFTCQVLGIWDIQHQIRKLWDWRMHWKYKNSVSVTLKLQWTSLNSLPDETRTYNPEASEQGLSEKDLPKTKVEALSPLQTADPSSEESLTYTWPGRHCITKEVVSGASNARMIFPYLSYRRDYSSLV